MKHYMIYKTLRYALGLYDIGDPKDFVNGSSLNNSIRQNIF